MKLPMENPSMSTWSNCIALGKAMARCRRPHVVGRQDRARRCQLVDQRRIPVAEIPREVLEKDQGNAALACTVMHILNAVGGAASGV
jgi:hypothetical protein